MKGNVMWIPVPLPNTIWPPFAFPNTMWIPAAFECGLIPTPYTCFRAARTIRTIPYVFYDLFGPPEPSDTAYQDTCIFTCIFAVFAEGSAGEHSM